MKSEAKKIVNNLFDEMQKRGLVVVHESELLSGEVFDEMQFRRDQKAALKLDALPVAEIVRLKLLPKYKTANGIKLSKQFLAGERYRNSAGHIMVCREAIKRLRKKFGLTEL